MKRLLAFLMTLVMAVGCCSALAEDYTAKGIGTFTLPEGYEVDDTTYLDENEEKSVWLFSAYNDAMTLEAYNDYLDDYEGVSLFKYTQEELDAYIGDTVDTLQEDDSKVTYVETVMAGKVPFIIYTVEGEEGLYYYAETIASGWCINLTFYNQDGTLPESELATLEEILKSFLPDA